MSVWKWDEKLVIFASLISPSKVILFEKYYQAFDTVFHHQMNHLEVRQKYSAARRILNSLLGVCSWWNTASHACVCKWWNPASHAWYITSRAVATNLAFSHFFSHPWKGRGKTNVAHSHALTAYPSKRPKGKRTGLGNLGFTKHLTRTLRNLQPSTHYR